MNFAGNWIDIIIVVVVVVISEVTQT